MCRNIRQVCCQAAENKLWCDTITVHSCVAMGPVATFCNVHMSRTCLRSTSTVHRRLIPCTVFVAAKCTIKLDEAPI